LKGGALVIDDYEELFYRYFSDVDFLINYDDISKVVKILYKEGYVQGYVVDGKIIQATRKDILFRQLNTHEIYDMVKLDQEGFRLNVDINFLFSWNGLDNAQDNYSLDEFASNLKNIEKMGVKVNVFDDELQFVHLCSHFYNEAVFFPLDPNYVSGEDDRELRLFRLLDIVIIGIKNVDVGKIHSLAERTNSLFKVEYVLSIMRMIMGQEYVEKFADYFTINTDPDNYFYTKGGLKVEWPISIHQRLFDLEAKKEALIQLSRDRII
jgi:hypothetical protein